MKLTRRFLALLLAFSMMFSMVTPAFASETEDAAEEPEVIVEEVIADEEVVDDENEDEEIVIDEVVPEDASAEEAFSGILIAKEVWTWNDDKTEGTYSVTGAYCYEVEYIEGYTLYIGETEVGPLVDDEDNLTAADLLGENVSEESPVTLYLRKTVTDDGDGGEEEGTETTETTVQLYPMMFADGTYTVTVAAGATCNVELYNCYGKLLSINGADPVVVQPANPMYPYTVSLTNSAEAEQAYVLTLSDPVGAYSNPDELSVEEANEATVEFGASGYFYNWTASDRGTLTITIDDACTNWFYCVNVIGGAYGDNYYSDDDEPVTSYTVAVNKGDTVEVVVNTVDYSAGTVTFTATFEGAAGSESNPYSGYINAETNELVYTLAPSGTIAAGVADYYSVYGIGGMIATVASEGDLSLVLIETDWFGEKTETTVEANEYGVLSAILPNARPVQFAVVNNGDAAAEYTVSYSLPTGHQMNPETLWGCGENTAKLLQGSFGYVYYYTFEVGYTGELLFQITKDESGTGFINIANQDSGTWNSYEADADGVITVPVTAGDELTIDLSAQYAGTITWTFNYPVGSDANPILLTEDWPETGAERTTTLTIGAGETVYGQGRFNGMYLTVPEGISVGICEDVYNYETGESSKEVTPYVSGELLPNARWNPTVLAITNDGEEEVTVNLVFAYPVGASNNPEKIEYLGGYASIEEGNFSGYYYSYTAEMGGYLTLWLADVPDGFNADITVRYDSLEYDGVENGGKKLTVAVTEGEEVIIQISRWDEAYTYAAAEIGWNGMISADKPGSTADCAYQIVGELPGTVTVTVPAGETLYYSARVPGMALNVPENISVQTALNFMMQMGDYVSGEAFPSLMMYPNILAITNNGETETIELTFAWPVGSQNNPAEISLGTNWTAQSASDSNGYYSTYTAEANGTMEFYFVNDEAGNGGMEITLENGETLWLVDEEDGVITLDVKKGDVLNIHTSYWSWEDVEYCWSINYIPGHELNPIALSDIWEKVSEIQYKATITVPAKTTYYYTFSANGCVDLSVNGSKAVTVYGSRWSAPEVRTLTNTGSSAKTYTVTLTNSVGSWMNPDPLKLGTESAKIVAGNEQGYLFTWTAPEDGYFSFAMTTRSGWYYQIANTTYGEYGNIYSDNENYGENVKNVAVHVSEGDVLQITVGKTRDSKTWTVPAGTITFKASFNPNNYELTSGKSLTLKYVHPETGVAYSASKVKWDICAIYTDNPYLYEFDDAGQDMSEYWAQWYGDDGDIAPEYFSAYATIKNGKLTTYKNGDNVWMLVRGYLDETDESTWAYYCIELKPATTLLTAYLIDLYSNEVDGEEYTEIAYLRPVYYGNLSLDLNGRTAADDDYLAFAVQGYPYNAADAVKWKVSGNAKIVEDVVVQAHEYEDETYYSETAIIKVYPVFDKYGNPKTGVATITGTAADGSGKKITFKVEMTKLPHSVEILDKNNKALPTEDWGWVEYEPIYDENGEWISDEEIPVLTKVVHVKPGQSYTFKADVDANAASNKKGVTWHCWYNGSNIVKNGTVKIPTDAVNGETLYLQVYTQYSHNYTNIYDEVVLVVDSDKTVKKVDINGWDDKYEWWSLAQYLPAIDVSSADPENAPGMFLTAWAYDTQGNPVEGELTWSLDKNSKRIATLEEGWYRWDEEVYINEYDSTYEARFGKEVPDDITYFESVVRIVPNYVDGAFKTGTVKVTATASDGVTKKTVSVKIESLVNSLSIKTKDNRTVSEDSYIWDYEYNPETEEYDIPVYYKYPIINATAGEKIQLQAVTNSNAKNKGVSWYTYDEYVKINSNGLVTISNDVPSYGGKAWIYAEAKDGSGVWAELCIDIVPRTTNIHLRMDKGEGMKYVSNSTQEWDLLNGNTFNLSALVYPFEASQDINWKVSNTKLATIVENEDGTATLTAKKTGKITITGTAKDGSNVKTSFTLNIVQGIEGMYFTQDEIYTYANKTVKLASMLKYEGAQPTVKDLQWTMAAYVWNADSGELDLYFDDNGADWVNSVPAVAKLDAKTGVLTIDRKLSEMAVILVQVYDQRTGESAVIGVGVAPKAISSVVVKNEAGTKLTKNATYVVDGSNKFILDITPGNINDKTFYTYVGDGVFDWYTDNEEIAWGDQDIPCIYAKEDCKVKVTVKTLDASNKSISFYIQFKNVPQAN